MGQFSNEGRSEEVAPEMRAASLRACAHLDVVLFFKGLETDVTFATGDEVGLPQHPFTQIWLRRFRAVVDPQTPVFAAPLRP